MSEGIPYADILILALVAGFILLRLRSILGHKIGNDEPDMFRKNIIKQMDNETIVRLSEKSLKPKPREETDSYLQTLSDQSISDTLKAIKLRDGEFSASEFLQGAKMAYEMVFDGFAKGDRTPLKMLLSDSIYKHFDAELKARELAQTHQETTLVSVAAKDISKAELDKNMARLSVKFNSEQVTVERDKDGKIVGGDASAVNEVEDEWTFERDVTSKNPNWKVIET